MGGCTTDGTGFFQKLRQRFGRRPPAERLTRSFVELVSHVVEFSLGYASQGMAFREVLPEKSVGVLRQYFPKGHTLRSEEHTSELQSHLNLVCRLLLEKKNNCI